MHISAFFPSLQLFADCGIFLLRGAIHYSGFGANGVNLIANCIVIMNLMTPRNCCVHNAVKRQFGPRPPPTYRPTAAAPTSQTPATAATAPAAVSVAQLRLQCPDAGTNTWNKTGLEVTHGVGSWAACSNLCRYKMLTCL